MPEINEVRRYADFIKSKLKTIKEINIINGRYKKHGPFPLYNELKKDLPINIVDIKTKGKFMYMILEYLNFNNFFFLIKNIFSTFI